MPKKRAVKSSEKPGSKSPFALHSRDLPATQGMLRLVRTEIKSEMRAGFERVNSRFNQTESRFNNVDSRFNQMESRFSDMDSRFNQMESRFSEMESRFNQIDSKFSLVDSRFSQVDSKFDLLNSRFDEVNANFAQVFAELAKIGVLAEQQESRNRAALEGLTGLWQRQARVEGRVDDVEALVREIARYGSTPPKSPTS